MRRTSLLVAGALALAWVAHGRAHAQAASALGDPRGELVPPPPIDPLALPLPPDLRLDAERLGTWLRVQDERAESARVEGGLWGVGLGAAQAGLGLWLMLDEATFGPIAMRGVLGGASLGLGLSVLAMGIYELTTTSFAHGRRQRWRRALARGLDARELGRFEGELRAEAELARFLRLVSVASGFVNAGAGLVTILATALAPLDGLGQLGGYTIGGTLALLGLIGALGSLLGESQAETEWRLYSSGHDPEEAASGVDLSIVPTVSPEGGGLELRGTF